MRTLSSVAQKLINWWKINGRKFPWRETYDTYRIFVAEILLHRTRAENVMGVYEKFLEKFPDVTALATARFTDVDAVIGKLGLRWRSIMLLDAARRILVQFNGSVPTEKEVLMKLPGVGEYIASAVVIFSSGKFLPLLDTNIVRVISRYLDIPSYDGSRRSEKYRRSVTRFVGLEDVRNSYFSIIDLGALVCRASAPSCPVCPIRETCEYAAKTAKVR
ncbi:MAG: DNA-binding protein [Candidatus Thermoplasmatota archaeon]|nr:DNA-binding protein [Candidatus Thermoplasmatota archaeon]